MHPGASPLLVASFLLVVLLGVALFSVAAGWAARAAGERPGPLVGRTAGFLLFWMAFTGALAGVGALADFTPPPRIMLVLVPSFVLTIAFALSPYGAKLALHLPLGALVGLQVFRLPLELTMHRAYSEGVMPVQMSFSGMNYDIVTGLLALAIALVGWRRELPRWVPLVFNVIGFALLAIIVTIAVLSMPAPWRVFHNEPANTWIAHFPFVWLPVVLVQLALFGHIVLSRRLLAEQRMRRSSE